jgi:flagellar assembly factor FliW
MTRLTLAHEPTIDVVTVASDLLGELRVAPTDLLDFPSGLLGFPECHDFALVRGAHDGTFWLQSRDYSTLAFLLVDPFEFVANYSIEIGPSQLAELGPHRPSDIALLTIVTLSTGVGTTPTANLQGPIAINFATRLAKQVVVSDTDFGIRYPIDLSVLHDRKPQK